MCVTMVMQITRDVLALPWNAFVDKLLFFSTQEILDACDDEELRPHLVNYLNNISIDLMNQNSNIQRCNLHKLNKHIPCFMREGVKGCRTCIRDQKYLDACIKYGVYYCLNLTDWDIDPTAHKYCNKLVIGNKMPHISENIQYIEFNASVVKFKPNHRMDTVVIHGKPNKNIDISNVENLFVNCDADVDLTNTTATSILITTERKYVSAWFPVTVRRLYASIVIPSDIGKCVNLRYLVTSYLPAEELEAALTLPLLEHFEYQCSHGPYNFNIRGIYELYNCKRHTLQCKYQDTYECPCPLTISSKHIKHVKNDVPYPMFLDNATLNTVHISYCGLGSDSYLRDIKDINMSDAGSLVIHGNITKLTLQYVNTPIRVYAPFLEEIRLYSIEQKNMFIYAPQAKTMKLTNCPHIDSDIVFAPEMTTIYMDIPKIFNYSNLRNIVYDYRYIGYDQIDVSMYENLEKVVVSGVTTLIVNKKTRVVDDTGSTTIIVV